MKVIEPSAMAAEISSLGTRGWTREICAGMEMARAEPINAASTRMSTGVIRPVAVKKTNKVANRARDNVQIRVTRRYPKRSAMTPA